MIECMNLEIEKISRGPEGYTITHSGAKQRSVKMKTKFLLPQEGGFADILAFYLEKVKTKQEGKVWYIGRKSATLTSLHMGRNMMFKVPHEQWWAKLLRLLTVNSLSYFVKIKY